MSAPNRHRPPTRLALATLHLYPSRWRRRYGDELRAHIEDHGVTARDLIDLACGALRERWRGPNGPDPGERPVAAAWWRGGIALMQRLAIATVLGGSAYGVGWMLGSVTGPVSDAAAIWLIWIALAVFGVVCGQGLYRAYTVTRLLPALPPPPRIRFAQRIAWTAAGLFLLVWAFLGSTHEPPTPLMIIQNWWLFAYPTFDDAFDRSGRRRRITDASRRYLGAREALKHARIELARLESLALPPTHPDVVRQHETVHRWETQMSSAIEILRDPERVDLIRADQ